MAQALSNIKASLNQPQKFKTYKEVKDLQSVNLAQVEKLYSIVFNLLRQKQTLGG